jgi:hypothetical protein
MTKKFKTIGGYLRSEGTDLFKKLRRHKQYGITGISEYEGRRNIINNLLPQMGVSGQILPGEDLKAGIQRLQRETPQHAKDLYECMKWLKWLPFAARFIPVSSTFEGEVKDESKAS